MFASIVGTAGSKGKVAGKAKGKEQKKGQKTDKKREKPAPVDAATLDMDMDACKSFNILALAYAAFHSSYYEYY